LPPAVKVLFVDEGVEGFFLEPFNYHGELVDRRSTKR
jgi:hypothetical protein